VKFNLMTTIESNKAMRGTKRVCPTCEVRFYDLMRDPILCPSCGAQHTPVAQPAVALGLRKAPAATSRWRQNAKSPGAVESMPDVENYAPGEIADSEDAEVAGEAAASASPEDDTVLVDQDGDEADVTDLVGLDVQDVKEG
jgi:uncharacterized protein (TIGR02300 family)